MDWIFSHAHELDSMEEESQGGQETGPQYKDGAGSMLSLSSTNRQIDAH